MAGRRARGPGGAGLAWPLLALIAAGTARAEETRPAGSAPAQVPPAQAAPLQAAPLQAAPASTGPAAGGGPASPAPSPAVAAPTAPPPTAPLAVHVQAPPVPARKEVLASSPARTAAPIAPAAQGSGPRAPAAPRPKAPLKVATISADPRPTLSPETFIATTRAADAYLRLAENGGWPSLPKGAPPKLGERGPMVAALRRRLAATGDLAPEAEAGDLFDDRVLAGVKAFQARHGLPETGLVGARTVAALNVPAAERYRQLTASANRLLGSAFAFGERYVVVNIPSASVEAVEGARVARRYVAVVGKKDRASPRVETRITNVNFNPTWTVPTSLIRKDIIPHMRKDPGYLAKHRIRILDGQGREVNPTAIDWSTERAVNFTLRQDPHAGNSLGQVRIDMPNRHAVYMHDTPTKSLFAGDARFHSSGCVRVADVRSLVEWLLQGAGPQTFREGAPAVAQAGSHVGSHAGAAPAAPLAAQPAAPAGPAPLFGGDGWSAADIEAAIASGKRLDVKLARPVPVAWVYLTGYATADGIVHFRDDVYGLDAPSSPALPPDDTQTSALPGAPPPSSAPPSAALPRSAVLPPRRP